MKRWLKAAAIAIGLLLLVILFGYLWMTHRGPRLTLATSLGPYSHAQTTALLLPFSDRAGTVTRVAEYDGGSDELARQVASKTYAWDVVDMELPDAVTACHQGLLEPIDAATLPAGPDGAPASQDFVTSAIGPCWVGSVVYSQIIAYDPRRFASVPPAALADFFDLTKFPGPRALRRTSGKFNLEMALLADGVPPGEVYATLSTPEGIARALTKLDTLGTSLVWSTNNDPPAKMIASGGAAFAMVLNGDIFDTATHQGRLGVIWDRQLYELDVFAIPKGNPKRAMAMDFVRYATQADRLGAVANWVPYGPARKSALPYVGENPDLQIEMAPYLPTTPEHFATAFAIDDEWWRLHGADVDALWQAWLAKGK